MACLIVDDRQGAQRVNVIRVEVDGFFEQTVGGGKIAMTLVKERLAVGDLGDRDVRLALVLGAPLFEELLTFFVSGLLRHGRSPHPFDRIAMFIPLAGPEARVTRRRSAACYNPG